MTMMTFTKKILGNLVSENSPSLSRFNRLTIMLFSCLVMVGLAQIPVFAETETTVDVTEQSAGATALCSRNDSECTADPRNNLYRSDGNDDVVYWDQHGHISSQYGNGTYDTDWDITNDISTFMTEEQMLAGFTMDSAIGVKDRNNIGGDAFRVEIKVTDGTTTYSDIANYTMPAGSEYQTVKDLRPALKVNNTLKICVLPNRIHYRTRLRTVKEVLKNLNIDILNTYVPQRKIFTIPSTIKAERRYRSIANEIIKIMVKG